MTGLGCVMDVGGVFLGGCEDGGLEPKLPVLEMP